MKRHTDKEIAKIKNLRLKNKYSYAYLSRLSGIPQSTIGHWFRADEKIPKEETILQYHIRLRNDLKESENILFHEIALTSINNAKLWAALLYWCEGAKYPASNALRFTNSDPTLIKTFLTLLRNGFSLDEKKFYVHLQIHSNHNYDALVTFWSDLLQIPYVQFIKPTITRPYGKKHRVDYRGTCTLRYQDYRLQLKLIGIYELFTKNINELTK